MVQPMISRPLAVARPGPLELKLQSFVRLQLADVEVIRACHEDARIAAAGSSLFGAATPASCRLITAGWAAQATMLRDGRRQILQIYLPGDVIGTRNAAGADAIALSQTTTVDATPIVAAVHAADPRYAGLRAAWAAAEQAREQQMLEHMVRLGRLSAYERTASLMLELIVRHRRAGLTDSSRIPWPLTQEVLGDVLGLSIVHVNRILQQLRRDGMIVLRAGQLLAPDLDQLALAACRDDI